MNRVVIIGSPGAGKSTFAQELARKTGLPLIHLDYYYHDKKHDYENDKEEWRSKVQELIKGKKWIMDGNYSSTYDVRLPAADTIIFFDLSRHTALWRVIKRRVKYHNKTRPDMPNTWREKADWEFLKYVWGFRKKYTSDIRSILEDFKDKNVFVISTTHEVKAFLVKIT